MRYNVWMVGFAAAVYYADFVMALVALNIPRSVYMAFFLYPHFFLIQEIRSGIMSPENYPNEEQSCCCV